MSLVTPCSTGPHAPNDKDDNLGQEHYRFTARVGVSEYVQINTTYSATENQKRNRLDAALALGNIEDLCQKLECLLAVDLEFRPNGKQSPEPAFIAIVDRSDGTAGRRQVAEVSFTAGLGSVLESNIKLIKDTAITWKEIDAQLELGRFQLSIDDRQRIKTGSLVLIPSSFGTRWNCTLRNTDLKLTKCCVLSKSLNTLTLNSGQSDLCIDSNQEPASVAVIMKQTQRINGLHLFDREPVNQESEMVVTTGDVHSAGLQGAEVDCLFSNHERYTGSLVSIGEGFSVYLKGRI